MGICLDTDQQDGSQVFEEAGAQNAERWRREAGILATPPEGNFPMQNAGPIKFEPPTVPVIFVLGGPGSGKVTHCDNLTQEKKGIVHINMTDLLQQYVLGNDMQDFGLLSSKTVTEVLMLEMKMSLGAKTFLVSGYPRNMRDVVEYSEKIQIVNGVVLIAWKQEVLERQIDYGAQLGQVIIELARMELQNFYKNVMPVAEYFDQSEILLVVNGERNPSEVYVDFRESVMRILGLTEESEQSKRQVSSSMEAEVDVERTQDAKSSKNDTRQENLTEAPRNPSTVIGDEISPSKTDSIPNKRFPPVVWILGGPGSNKAMVCQQAIKKMPNWVHVSISSLLVSQASSNSNIHELLVAGELVPTNLVMPIVEQQILLNRNRSGIILDGFPRDLGQLQKFEQKFGQRTEMLLLDVSKQQSGRGRLYDRVEAFGRRLELFRELSLPMLKSLDSQGRLSIVDGDTEIPADQQQFASALLELMRRAARNEDDPNRISVLESEGETKDKGNLPPNGIAKPVGNGSRRPAKSNGQELLKVAAFKVIAQNRQQRQRQQQNGQQGSQPQLLQNGVAMRMVNGFLPSNRVAPTRMNNNQEPVDPLRRIYTEVESVYDRPPTNLHI